jgi:hypothetical protein
MQRTLLAIVFITLTSCSKEHQMNGDFVDKVLDLTIETSTGELIELPELYDKLADRIPDDSNEKLVIVERLKSRGFTVTNWGRGNMPPLGPRIVSIQFQKDNCSCDVSKMYYSTTVDSLFQVVERISCKRTRD